MTESLSQVRARHRRQIATIRQLCEQSEQQLKGIAENRDLFQELGDLLYSPDPKGRDRQVEVFRGVISIPSQLSNLKQLVQLMDQLIKLERVTLGMNEADAKQGSELDQMLLKFDASRKSAAGRASLASSGFHRRDTSSPR